MYIVGLRSANNCKGLPLLLKGLHFKNLHTQKGLMYSEIRLNVAVKTCYYDCVILFESVLFEFNFFLHIVDKVYN